MPEVSSYDAGTPCWIDLSTSDPEGARDFYGALFGWEFDIGGPETGNYTMAMLDGRSTAGLAGQPAPQGMPTAWTVYLSAADADAAAQRTTEGGGSVLMGPMDVMDLGRMLIGTDPTGAVFGVWQPRTYIGASLVNEPGAVVWHELATRDLAAAQEFYTRLAGYDWEAVDTGAGGPAYEMFKVNGKAVAGALQMTDEWPSELPSHWLPYFQVDDTDAAVETVRRLGGQVHVPPRDSAYGRWANTADPQGGVFYLVTPPA